MTRQPGKLVRKLLILALVVALPLLLSTPSSAESGCHKSGGSTPTGAPRK